MGWAIKVFTFDAEKEETEEYRFHDWEPIAAYVLPEVSVSPPDYYNPKGKVHHSQRLYIITRKRVSDAQHHSEDEGW